MFYKPKKNNIVLSLKKCATPGLPREVKTIYLCNVKKKRNINMKY